MTIKFSNAALDATVDDKRSAIVQTVLTPAELGEKLDAARAFLKSRGLYEPKPLLGGNVINFPFGG